jgi:hypothetical protein
LEDDWTNKARSSSDGISSDGGMSGFAAGGGWTRLGKLKSFVLNKISSFRNMPEDDDTTTWVWNELLEP